eukprot:scaffold52448_cov60-Phaeocystis_antarctica.AAC.3
MPPPPRTPMGTILRSSITERRRRGTRRKPAIGLRATVGPRLQRCVLRVSQRPRRRRRDGRAVGVATAAKLCGEVDARTNTPLQRDEALLDVGAAAPNHIAVDENQQPACGHLRMLLQPRR